MDKKKNNSLSLQYKKVETRVYGLKSLTSIAMTQTTRWSEEDIPHVVGNGWLVDFTLKWVRHIRTPRPAVHFFGFLKIFKVGNLTLDMDNSFSTKFQL